MRQRFLLTSNNALISARGGAKDNRAWQLALALSLSLSTALVSEPNSAAAAAPPSQATSNQAATLNNEGVKALNASNFQLAIQKFEEALKLDPNYSFAKENLAIAYNNYGLKLPPAQALKQFHKSLALNPANATTQQNLEGVIQMLGKNPRSFKDRVELGKQARMSGDFEGAIVEYSNALKLQNDAKLHVDLGDVYRVRDRVDEAVNEYQNAIRAGLEPNDVAMAYVKLGQSYQAKKDLPRAIESFGNALKFKSDDRDVLDALKTGWEEALKENPTAPENHIGLGQAYQYLGDFGQAEAEYKQALVFDKSNAIARKLLAALPDVKKQSFVTKHINAGVDLQGRKLYDQAIAEYMEGLKADPSNPSLWLDLGTAFQAKLDFERAVQAYNKVLGLDPGNKAAALGVKTAGEAKAAKALDDLTKQASDLYKTGKYAESLASYQKVVQQTPNDAAIHFNIAAALQQLGRLDESIAEYQQAVRIEPKNEDYQKFLEAVLDKKADPIIASAVKKHQDKDYPAAIDLYQQAISLRPKNVSLYYNLAGAYYSREQYPEAQRMYQKALELDPKGQVDDMWLLGTIQEHFGKGPEAMDIYKKYLSLAPNGKFAQPAKSRLESLAKNPGDTVKIKSESELSRLKEASEAYQAAVKLQQEKRYDEAVPLYQKAMTLQPAESAYPFGLGTLFQYKGDMDLAINWFQKAIAMEPKNTDYPKALQYAIEQKAQPLVDEGVKKQTAGDFASAIDLYQKALTLVPKNARIYTNLATACQGSDDFAGARQAYQKALDLDPKSESADWYPAAAIDENFAKGPLALSEYKKFVAANPGSPLVSGANERIKKLTANPNDTQKLPTQAQMKASQSAQDAFDQGLKLQQASKFDEAIPLYTKASMLVPSEPAYAFALASAYQGKGDMDNAIVWYRKSIDLDPKNKEYGKYLSAAYDLKAAPLVDEASKKYTSGDYPGAVELYRKALQVVPNNAPVHTDLASCLQATDDFAGARAEYQKAFDVDPKGQIEDLYFIGALDEHFGRGAQALDEFRKYLMLNPRGKFISYAQSRAAVLSKNPNDTQKLQTQSEQKQSAQVQELYDQAVKAQQAGKFDEAQPLYQKLVQMVPSEPAYAYAFGTNFQGQGNFDLAITWYEKAVALDPRNAEFKKILQAARDGKAAPIIDEAVKKHTAGDLTGAIELYKQALAIVPKNAKLHTNIATAYQASDSFSAARDEFQKGFDLDQRGEVDNLYFLAAIDEHLGKGAQALASYTKYLQLAPRGNYVQLAKSRYNELYYNPNKTQKLVTQAQQKQATAANDAYNNAVKLQQEGKLDEAIAQYQEALKAQGNEASFWYSLGTAYQAKSDFDQALASYQKAEQLNPKEQAYKKLVKELKGAKAAPLLESAFKKQTTKDDKGNFDLPGAIADYEAAARLDDDATTRLNLGTAYQANKMTTKAIENYNRALQLDGKQYDACYYLGTCYEAMNQRALAISEYRKYLQFQPSGQYAGDVKARLKTLGASR